MTQPTEELIGRLLEWFVEHGGSVHPSVRFAPDSTGSISALANQDIPNPPVGGTPICTCPPKLQLSHRHAPEALQGLLPETVLSNIALIKELLLGEQSLWAPYFDCLPRSNQLTTPVYFEEEMTQDAINEKRNDTAWLLGTNLDKAWRSRHEQWKEDWENACRIMEKQGIQAAGYTWELYKWAGTMFTSRSFPSDPGFSKENTTFPVLLPIIDLLNHRFPSKVNWFFNNGAFQLSVEELILKDQEIFNNYGGKGNEELLNGYGFCVRDNPCDYVAIRFGQIPEPVVTQLEKVLGAWDPSQSHYVRGHNHYDGLYNVSIPECPEATRSGVPQTIWTVMEVLKKYQDAQQGQRAAWRSELSARCDLLEILATKYDNIDQYCDFLPEKPRNAKQQYANIYRDGQMRILKENVEDVEKILQKENFVSLDDAVRVLKEEREEVGGRDWEQAMDITFKTDDLPAIREEGVEREAWILWFCAAWLYTSDKTTGSSRIYDWIKDLLESHPYDESASDSHLNVVIRQLRAHAPGIWQSPRFGQTLYHWAARVVDAEARMLAYLEENERSGRLLVCMKEK